MCCVLLSLLLAKLSHSVSSLILKFWPRAVTLVAQLCCDVLAMSQIQAGLHLLRVIVHSCGPSDQLCTLLQARP